ncbi:hypothetical protein TcWFU_005547 [Taenia crassiceps]|uniref:Uncharacterized protein n=1 Tax=Taenia crassiceps TaxID=6207 RepID=A0ABR4QDS4_9CEST
MSAGTERTRPKRLILVHPRKRTRSRSLLIGVKTSYVIEAAGVALGSYTPSIKIQFADAVWWIKAALRG